MGTIRDLDTQVIAVSRGGLKSVRLDQLPEEAWTYIRGGSDVSRQALDRYKDVPWLYRGVNLRADALASLPWGLFRGEDEVENPESEDSLGWLNQLPRILNGIEADRTLYGAAYNFKMRNRVKMLEFRRLSPHTIQPEYDAENGLTGFVRSINGTQKKMGTDKIFYSWLPNRDAEIGPGTAPAAAALKAADLLNSGDKLLVGYFDRGTIRPVVIAAGGVTQAEANRFSNWFKEMATGLSNAFNAFAVRGERLSTIQLGDKPNELQMPELTASKREDIATALGIPHSLLFSNAANYATARQDDIHLYDKTIVPEAEAIAADLNAQVFEPMGLEFRFKPEELEIYQSIEAEKAEKLGGLLDRRVITINEAREQLGLPPMEDFEQGYAAPTPALPDPNVIDGEAQEVTPMQEEVGKWLRMAANRVREGKPEKVADFESDIIPASLMAATRGALKAAGNNENAILSVIKGLEAWESYP